MSQEYRVTTIYCEKEYDHGKIEVERQDYYEAKVSIELDFTISAQDRDNLHEEIQEVVRKFAI